MLMDNNQICRNCFVIIYSHLTKVSSQINKCIIFVPNELSITLSTLWLHSLSLPRMHQLDRVTRDALVAHRYSFAPPRYRTSYRRIFVPLSLSLCTDIFYVQLTQALSLAAFKCRANALLLA